MLAMPQGSVQNRLVGGRGGDRSGACPDARWWRGRAGVRTAGELVEGSALTADAWTEKRLDVGVAHEVHVA